MTVLSNMSTHINHVSSKPVLKSNLTMCVSTTQATAQNLDLPALPYGYDALEPYIDEATMKVHHLGHHQAYTTTINGALTALRNNEATKHLAKMVYFPPFFCLLS